MHFAKIIPSRRLARPKRKRITSNFWKPITGKNKISHQNRLRKI